MMAVFDGEGRLGSGLSAAARAVWAKHDHEDRAWLPVWRHMADSAAVAGRLWDDWLPASVKRLVADCLPRGAEDARTLAVWLAGSHDVGKATPAFACQVEPLAQRMVAVGLDMRPQRMYGDDRRLARHEFASQRILQAWLKEQFGWRPPKSAQFAVVLGGHHGTPPSAQQLRIFDDHPEFFRTPGDSEQLWADVQRELLEACVDDFDVRGRLPEWEDVRLPQTAQVALSALVIVADWIASNRDLFPYEASRNGTGQRTDAGNRLDEAWQGLGLPPPWTPQRPTAAIEALFAERFTLPEGASPRPVQVAGVEAAYGLGGPGMLVVEAPMGEGKTEIAFAAAEVLAARTGAGGVFFALPTMATGSAMFPRQLTWLDRLPTPDGEPMSVQLVHSKAALNDDLRELRNRSWRELKAVSLDGDQLPPRPGSENRHAPAGLVAHQWLSGRKKAMLSSFVVGTIDQLLFAGLKSRHLALRHLALAGKVVVIDEAHAFDTYMNSYLDRALSWLGRYGVPVVVLSATLPARRRQELAEAYAGEKRGSAAHAAVGEESAYPLVTAVAAGNGPVLRRPEASGRRSTVRTERLADDLPTLVSRLRTELADGGNVLVIRNTVGRVVETATALRAEFGEDVEVTVAHSRFCDLDRKARDQRLRDLFGPEGDRPERHVVVASQVAEQSLDVDFDLLVTDLAPVDLVLQRMGRLHRHRRTGRPERLREPVCLVTGAEWPAEGPPEPVAGSVAVYGRWALLRSAAALLPHLNGEPVDLPAHISPLVQDAYGDRRLGPDDWQDAVAAAADEQDQLRRRKRRKARAFQLADPAARPGTSINGWVDAGAGDADDTRAGRAQVRDTEDENLEVLLVQEQADGTWTTLPWLPDGNGGLELPTSAVPAPRAARAAAASAIRLPRALAHPGMVDRTIAELEEFCVEAWQTKECHWLAGELVLPVQRDCQTRLAGFRIKYSESDGLEVTRDE